jgi:formimidoylglutamate deiminase
MKRAGHGKPTTHHPPPPPPPPPPAALATLDHSTGRVLFDAGLAGGAQASGRDSGRIAPGALADLIGLDDDNEWLCNRSGDRALDSLIFGSGARACLRDVWSAGRHVVR